jgi:putative transposase
LSKVNDDAIISTPSGVKAISRWLSEATPPVHNGTIQFDPGRGRSFSPLEPYSDKEHIMRSTYLSLHYHLVFGTKNREPSIATEWRSRLHEYMGGTITGLGGFPQGIGGVADHVHLLVGLKATHCLADVLRELKKASSIWVHDHTGPSSFAWQEGYAAFTVSATAREAVQGYIANQEEHHRTQSSREELVAMLERAGIKFDPQYLD